MGKKEKDVMTPMEGELHDMRKRKPNCKTEEEEEEASDQEGQEPKTHFLSPIAEPLIEGKTLERALKLLKKTLSHEHTAKEIGKTTKALARQLKRGVAEVTKALRKGQKGVVFMASDVHPVDIIAHLPSFCEDKGVLYCFLGTKRLLGGACKTKRPASVIMVCQPTADMPNHEVYQKFSETLKKIHPYF